MVVQMGKEFKVALAKAEARGQARAEEMFMLEEVLLRVEEASLPQGAVVPWKQVLRVFSHGGSGIQGNEEAHIEPVSQFWGAAGEQ